MDITPIGFGAVKIGRNEAVKYPVPYVLPDDDQVSALLNGVLDLGVNFIDTAPAYGLSEQRIGRTISHRRTEFVLSTKVGESFVDGRSTFDFSKRAIHLSIDQSRQRLGTQVLDLVLIHSDGRDMHILEHTDAVTTLLDLRQGGTVRAVGLSGKTSEGLSAALAWADVLMVDFSGSNRQHAQVLDLAKQAGVGILVKKGLGSGHLAAPEAIRFVLGHAAVSSLVVGTLNLDHVRQNVRAAEALDGSDGSV
jgi:aryl-alcohol dehydrogenase-like predicted oxidoreductase